MKEEAARELWCPLIRTDSYAEPGNHGADMMTTHTQGKCRASDCMAWRSQIPGDGWCGLAGNPGACS